MAIDTQELRALPPEQIRALYGNSGANPHLALDVFSLSAVGMGIVSPSGFWLQSNQALADLFGYDPEEFAGLAFLDLILPDDLEATREAQARLNRQEIERAQLDVRCRREDGELLWTRQHLTALRIPGRDAMYTLVQIEDITALKAAERTGQRRGEIYRAIVRNLPGAIAAVFDRELRYLVVEGHGLAEVGLSSAMLEGQTVCEAWGAAHCAAVSDYLRATLDGQSQRYETTLNGRDFEVRSVPIADADGAIDVGVVIMHDITERKLHEREIQVASEALARSNRELEQFAVVASHDLRAPLVSLHGLATILADEYRDKLDVEGRYILERIVANAAQMGTLLNDLLNISRVGRVDSDFTPLDLAEVVSQALDQQQFSLQRRGGELTVDLDGVMVEANWTRMLQLFSNLIDNAIQYTPPERAPVIAITARPEGSDWLVSVADNGVGIPEDHREDVFGMFHRLRSGTQLNPGGTGMGLALVARIVQLHGGQIWIDPDTPAGTTFHFTIPRLETATITPTGKDQGPK